jgi:tetratricopeptide (TPR) repeat protein
VQRASSIQDVEERRRAIERVGAHLESAAARTRTAALLYLLGYAWYFHPDRASSRAIQDKVETALRSALEVEPKFARAWMYLGHHAFDLGNYDEARRFFDKVDSAQLGTYWQMRLFEMRLCCAIAIDGLAPSLGLFEDFVRKAEESVPQDVWPSNLAKWVKAQAAGLEESDKVKLRQLGARLDRAGQFGEWFSSLTR